MEKELSSLMKPTLVPPSTTTLVAEYHRLGFGSGGKTFPSILNKEDGIEEATSALAIVAMLAKATRATKKLDVMITVLSTWITLGEINTQQFSRSRKSIFNAFL